MLAVPAITPADLPSTLLLSIHCACSCVSSSTLSSLLQNTFTRLCRKPGRPPKAHTARSRLKDAFMTIYKGLRKALPDAVVTPFLVSPPELHPSQLSIPVKQGIFVVVTHADTGITCMSRSR